MNTKELLAEIEFEQNPNANAQTIINASNIETYDWKIKFYSDLK